MIRRLGTHLERFFRAVTPDPFVLAILLTVVTGAAALLLTGASAVEVLDAWQGPRGFWGLLAFGMQMCLVLVTGHALGSAPLVARLIARLAERPKTPGGAAALVAFAAVLASFVNWGLTLIVGALLARETGRAALRRGVPVHYPLLAAAGYTGMMTWHGGFSGSAPLKVTTERDLLELLGPELAARVPPVPIEATLLGGLNLFVSGGLLVLVPLLALLLAPKAGEPMTGIDAFPAVAAPAPVEVPPDGQPAGPGRLERSPWVMLLLGAPLLLALASYYGRHGISRLDPNAVNLTLLTAGLLLHGSPRAYAQALGEAVPGCAGIMLQFPLYGGIMGIMAGTGLAALVAGWAASSGSATIYGILTFLAAAVINFFVPSGGGQWAVQGPIAVEAAETLGVPLSTAVMAVAYGDQWSNMLQPFWALPLLGITGVRAGDIIGYTATIMAFSGLWIVLGLLVWG